MNPNHAEPPDGRTAVPAQHCDGCGHPEHRARECPAVEYGERCACDEPITMEDTVTHQPDSDARAALRDRITDTMREHYLCTNRDEADADGNMPCRCGDWREPGPMGSDEDDWDTHLADAVLAVLPDHAAEIARLQKEHATWRKLGQRNLERAHEENARLRAEQAATLERIREVVRRLAAHAVGFQDVLDDSDRGPWGKTVAADIAELRRMAAAARPDDTRTEAGPAEPASPRCAVCNHPKRDHSDRTGQAPSTVVPRRPWCHACDATCDYADPSARPDDTTGATP